MTKTAKPGAAADLPPADTAAAPPAAAGSLEDLAQQADALGGVTDLDVAEHMASQEQAQAGPSNAVLVAQMIGAVRDTVCMVAGLEAPARTLTDDKADKLGEIWGGVLDHYGIKLSDLAGRYGVIIAATIATFPLVRDTVIETRKEIALKDARPATLPAPSPDGKPAAPAPAPVNGQTFAPGVVRPAFQS